MGADQKFDLAPKRGILSADRIEKSFTFVGFALQNILQNFIDPLPALRVHARTPPLGLMWRLF